MGPAQTAASCPCAGRRSIVSAVAVRCPAVRLNSSLSSAQRHDVRGEIADLLACEMQIGHRHMRLHQPICELFTRLVWTIGNARKARHIGRRSRIRRLANQMAGGAKSASDFQSALRFANLRLGLTRLIGNDGLIDRLLSAHGCGRYEESGSTRHGYQRKPSGPADLSGPAARSCQCT